MNASLQPIKLLRLRLLEKLPTGLRYLIVAGVFILNIAVALVIPQRFLLFIPLALAGFGTTLLLLRYPQLGIVALIFTIIIPFNGPSGVNATMALVALLIGLWFSEMIIWKKSFEFIDSITIKPILIFIFISILAFLVGQLPWFNFVPHASMGAQLGGLSMFILSAGVFLVVSHKIRNIKYIKWIVWIFLAIGSIFLFTAWFLPNMGVYTLSTIANRLFTYTANGSQFWTWILALAFSQALFNQDLSTGWRLAIGALVLETLYVGLFELREWNSGWVPMMVAIIGILWIAKPKWGLTLSLFGAFGGIIWLQNISRFVMIGDNQYSLSTRTEAWSIILGMVKESPILGFGPSNYRAFTLLFPIRGWVVEFNSHSQFVDLLAQSGILGIICFLWFFASVGWVGWRLRNQGKTGFERAYIYSAFGGLLATMAAAAFGDWVIPFFYNVSLRGFRASFLGWLFLGGLIAIEMMHKNSSSHQETINC